MTKKIGETSKKRNHRSDMWVSYIVLAFNATSLLNLKFSVVGMSLALFYFQRFKLVRKGRWEVF